MSNPDTSAIHVWLVTMKAHQALEKQAKSSIEATGLCFSDFRALELLLHKGTVPINALGEHLSLTSGSLTTMVDRLEKKELLARQFAPDDRRVRLISLTKSGKKLIQALFKQHCLDMEEALSGLTPKERQQLIQLLKKAGKAV
jgi:MarR family transcriptional regulator, 2-MHQ and catechol-resistance regulon repressor